MPTLNLFINTPVDGVVASDILKDATKAVAKTIGKPESVKTLFFLQFMNRFSTFAFAHYVFDDIHIEQKEPFSLAGLSFTSVFAIVFSFPIGLVFALIFFLYVYEILLVCAALC